MYIFFAKTMLNMTNAMCGANHMQAPSGASDGSRGIHPTEWMQTTRI